MKRMQVDFPQCRLPFGYGVIMKDLWCSFLFGEKRLRLCLQRALDMDRADEAQDGAVVRLID